MEIKRFPLSLRALAPFCLVALSVPAWAQEANEKAQRYYDSLLKRPVPGAAFDRFYGAWLDTETLESLEKWLVAKADAPDAPAGARLLLAYFTPPERAAWGPQARAEARSRCRRPGCGAFKTRERARAGGGSEQNEGREGGLQGTGARSHGGAERDDRSLTLRGGRWTHAAQTTPPSRGGGRLPAAPSLCGLTTPRTRTSTSTTGANDSRTTPRTAA